MIQAGDLADRQRVAAFLASRDEEAFREIYRTHTPVLYRIALRVLSRDAPGAEDAVQLAWMRGVRGLAGFRWESSLRTWLIGIVIRCCRESYRGGESREMEVTDAASRATARAERIDLERAVAALPQGYREILVLHDVEGYSHREIAAWLGIAEGTSKSQLSHARRAVRRRLGGAPLTMAREEDPEDDRRQPR
jgi:RNA polymerase sigma-70 factor (ECF subfamily)